MENRVVKKVVDFNLEHIFDCGQCFRWNKENDGSYTGVAFDKPMNIIFKPYDEKEFVGEIEIQGISEDEFENVYQKYLDLNRDYTAIKKELRDKDKVLKKAIKYGEGIRILNQDFWEIIISFIISQNNNIKRIKGCVEKLCQLFGEPLGDFRGEQRYGFPKAEVLSKLSVDDLAEVKLGYRAKYIVATSKEIVNLKNKYYKEKNGELEEKFTVDDYLNELRCMDISEIREVLSSFTGVGPKVANCILLFGAGKTEAFPVDVWVKRVMSELYGLSEDKPREMEAFAEDVFGIYGGIAQQYLFYYIREREK